MTPVLSDLHPATLHALAAAIQARDPELVARRQLTDEGLERLADLLIAGDRPTIGFWRKYRVATT